MIHQRTRFFVPGLVVCLLTGCTAARVNFTAPASPATDFNDKGIAFRIPRSQISIARKAGSTAGVFVDTVIDPVQTTAPTLLPLNEKSNYYYTLDYTPPEPTGFTKAAFDKLITSGSLGAWPIPTCGTATVTLYVLDDSVTLPDFTVTAVPTELDYPSAAGQKAVTDFDALSRNRRRQSGLDHGAENHLSVHHQDHRLGRDDGHRPCRRRRQDAHGGRHRGGILCAAQRETAGAENPRPNRPPACASEFHAARGRQPGPQFDEPALERIHRDQFGLRRRSHRRRHGRAGGRRQRPDADHDFGAIGLPSLDETARLPDTGQAEIAVGGATLTLPPQSGGSLPLPRKTREREGPNPIGLGG